MAREAARDKIPRVTSKRITYDSLKTIEPLTPAQEITFREYNKGKHLFLHGYAGTGKTFLAVYLAVREILLRESPYTKLLVVRSTVPVREQGYLPGDVEDKEQIYQLPYYAIFKELFHDKDCVEKLRLQDIYQFISTSYVRGITLHNTIVLVDECENCNLHELDSIITRLGENCKIIFCGDKSQSDLLKSSEKNGISSFLRIIDNMDYFSHIEFREDDIIRSEFVKQYIIKKKELNIE